MKYFFLGYITTHLLINAFSEPTFSNILAAILSVVFTITEGVKDSKK